MPFDSTDRRNPSPPVRRGRPVALWLFAMCGMLLVTVVVGGTTRLTGSGLSIMEWAPLSGMLPPLSHAEWERVFALYQQIPQAKLLHPDLDLSGFKWLFWPEWFHRFWNRLIGIAFALPLAWFAVRGAIDLKLGLRLFVLLLLGGLQGAVGWFMVASGFEPDSTAVSAYRLVAHLTLALSLYAAILWTALGLWQPEPLPLLRAPAARHLAGAALGLVALTIVAGGFVAGTHAGLINNTWPLMEGRIVPPDYGAVPLPRGLFENLAAVQWDHRALATLTLLVATTAAVAGARIRAVRRRALALGVAVGTQYALGVATLLWVVPVPLAALHQAVATGVLTAALVLRHGLRPARVRTLP